MRRWALLGFILIVIAGGVGGVLWFRQESTRQGDVEVLRTDRVTTGDLEVTVSASGRIVARDKTPVIVTTSGTVERVRVDVNDEVRAGDILATIETSDLARAVRQAEIALEQAELALATAQKPVDPEELRVAEAAFNSAAHGLELARLGREVARVDAEALMVQAQRQREYAADRYYEKEEDSSDRERALRALGDAQAEERIASLSADLTLEQADAQWQIAYSSYVQAQTNLEALRDIVDETTVRQRELQVEQARLRLQQAERTVEEAVITAPHSGVIADVQLLEGVSYRGGETAFVVVDASEYYVELQIDEIDIGALSIGQRADLSLDAYPASLLSSIVDSIAPSATNIGGLIAYDVRLRVEDLDGLRVLDGMTGTARIVTAIVENALLIPSWAVRVDSVTAETYCYRLVDGVAKRTTIELGQRDEQYSEVLSGLNAGDEVALVTTQRSLLDLLPQGPPGGFEQ